MTQKKLPRVALYLLLAVLLGGAFAFAFWPRPTMVDIGKVTVGEMKVTIGEVGRTRVKEAFVVSTPVNGRLLRVEAHSGDPVEKDKTIVARMRPANPAALDVRTREQAWAAVQAAEAALRLAEANQDAAKADYDLAHSNLERTQQLAERGIVSEAALDRVRGTERAAQARLSTADATIAQRKAEQQSAQVLLMGFDGQGLINSPETGPGEEMLIYAPTDGVILRVIHEDETTLQAGSPILEIGDVSDDLEVVVDLISSDAVQVEKDDPVIIENWGGGAALAGIVTRVEPLGVSKFSALGVEEQRVAVVVAITSTPELRVGLGHGYSVDARIVIWQTDEALRVPSSALFRNGDKWAVFAFRDGVAIQQEVRIGHDNGLFGEVLDGLVPDDLVVLYPPGDLEDGMAISERVVQ